jgi:hypothetical protein
MSTKEYEDGIVRYDGISWAQQNSTNPPLGASEINDIIIDKNNNAWIATSGSGLYRTDKKFLVWEVFDYDSYPITSDYVKVLTEDSAGQIWIVTSNDGIAVYNPDSGIATTSHPHEQMVEDDIIAYPTIFRDEITINVQSEKSSSIDISLHNLFGQTVKKQHYSLGIKALHIFHLNTTNLPAGQYLLAVNLGDKHYSQVFLKQ